MSDDDLPEAPFIAARVGHAAVYHTERCLSVERSTRTPREVTDAEIAFHDLSLCQRCTDDCGGQTPDQAGRTPADWLPSTPEEGQP